MASALDELTAAILADPDADAPRSAWAEAIEPTDPHRAELIRIQLRLAREWGHPDAPRELVGLYDRMGALLQAEGARWTSGVPAGVKAALHRGFIEELTLPASAWLAERASLRKLGPIEHLTLTEAKPGFDALTSTDALEGLRSLALWSNGLGNREAKLLAACPHLRALRWLELSDNDLGVSGVEALCSSAMLPALRYVGLRNNHAPDPGDQVSPGDQGYGLYVEPSAFGAELESRLGRKAFLHCPVGASQWPPSRHLPFEL